MPKIKRLPCDALQECKPEMCNCASCYNHPGHKVIHQSFVNCIYADKKNNICGNSINNSKAAKDCDCGTCEMFDYLEQEFEA